MRLEKRINFRNLAVENKQTNKQQQQNTRHKNSTYIKRRHRLWTNAKCPTPFLTADYQPAIKKSVPDVTLERSCWTSDQIAPP